MIARERKETREWADAMREHAVIADEVQAAMREMTRLARPRR